MADRVGQQLGNYRLIRLIGRGGYGEVYLAKDINSKTTVAIKVLPPLANEDIKSFLNEARTFRLKHPHILQILDFGIEDDTPFLVMEYAPNGTLRQRHPRGTLVPLATVVSYVEQIAGALQYAHDQKLIHRDIKPENMLLGPYNDVLLGDFGIATMSHATVSRPTQEVIGTIAYMAPEQVQGKPSPASDQYALGVVIYEWLSGKPPFAGSFSEVISQHLYAPPKPLRESVPGIFSGVEKVVLKALAKDPHERYASVREFAQALERASQPKPLSSPPQQGYMPLMTCENCGEAIPDNAVICPHCGTVTQASRSKPQQSSYIPQQQGYMPPLQNYGYEQQQYAPPPMYQQGVNVTVVNNPGTNKSNTPVLVEVLLNVFLGIYGVGWLMAGESTTGIVLLICSFVLYWPILIAIGVFTLGLGLFCDVPIWIGAVILNAVLLNSALNRKASQITVVQTSPPSNAEFPPPSPPRGFLAFVLAVLKATARLIITFIQTAYEWFQQQVVPRVKRFIRLVYFWFRQQVIPRFKSPVSSGSGQIQPQWPSPTITSFTVSPDLLPDPSTMQFTESALPADELKDFFISYNRKDEEIAEWIAWQLEEAGYSTIMPKWDFRPGSNFEMEMRKARAKTKRTIVVLSPDYLKARNSMAEWSHVFQQHTTGGQDILLPVCVRDSGPKLKRLLGSMVYIDLVGRDRPQALEMLLAHVRGERIKPKIEPEFVVRPTTEPANLTNILFATLNFSKPRKPGDAGKSIPATPVDTPAKVFTQEQKIQQPVPDAPEEAAQHQQAPIPVEQQVEQTVRRTSGVGPSTDQQVDTEPAVKNANTEPVVKGIEIFFSYSHKDEELRNELDEHLSTLKQLKLITAWHDKEIGAGKNWAHEIDKRLSKACIILLLVSPSFMASRYCYSIEMNKAMERHEAGEALVIPILIRPVDWEDAPFDKLQMLPRGAKAVTKWLNRDEAFEDIAKSIRIAVNELHAKVPNQ